MKRLILLAGLFFYLTEPSWAGIKEGLSAYQNGDYATALREWKPLAEKGDAYAQRNLAAMFQNGYGVRRNYVLAYVLFDLAAPKVADAAKFRDALARSMTPAQVKKAAKLAKDARRADGAAILGQALFAAMGERRNPAKKPRASRKPCEKSISPADIVGKWQSSPTLSQLGFMQITVQFNEDRTFTTKNDFLSFPTHKPDMEYYWIVTNGTYAVFNCEIGLNVDKTWLVMKMRGEDETRRVDKIEGKQRPQVFHWEAGKLVTKDLALTRIEPK